MRARPLKRFMFSMTVSVFMFSFECCVGRMYLLVPFVFNQNSIMFRYAWKYFRLFPLFFVLNFWTNGQYQSEANCFNDSNPLCAISFVWCRFIFIFHAFKQKFDVPSTSWVNKKCRVPFTDCVGYSLSYFILRLMVCRCSSYHIDLVILYDSIQKDANLSHDNNNGDFVDENPISMFHTHVSCTIVPCTMLSALHIIYRINTYISKCKASFCSMCTIVSMFAWKALAKPKTNSSNSP